jgi:hypothetical protein
MKTCIMTMTVKGYSAYICFHEAVMMGHDGPPFTHDHCLAMTRVITQSL